MRKPRTTTVTISHLLIVTAGLNSMSVTKTVPAV
ncbi:MAG: hypothetical protein OMOMHJEC_00849 [Xanthomonadales bacterium]|nr:hypothetical protein [Xanthomonadales bacterium]